MSANYGKCTCGWDLPRVQLRANSAEAQRAIQPWHASVCLVVICPKCDKEWHSETDVPTPEAAS